MTVDSGSARMANKQTLRRAMQAITALALDAFTLELHESATFALPFEDSVSDCGRDGFLQLLSTMFAMFKKIDLTITTVYDLVDPDVLIAQWHSDAEGREKPISYLNEYIGVFHFRDHKIASWRGYANPDAARAALAKFAQDVPAVNS